MLQIDRRCETTRAEPSSVDLRLTREIESGRHEWILLHDVDYGDFVVPKGFKTDLGSIPRAFWWLIGPQEIAHGAILHDYLYDQAVVPRKEADKHLHDLIIPEVGRFRARLVWAAVRLFGSKVYGLDRRL